MAKNGFLVTMLVIVLAFGIVLSSCDTGTGDEGIELAGTVWNGRCETPASFSIEVRDNKISWDHDRGHATDLVLQGSTFTSGQSLAGTVWSGGNMTLTFFDATRAIPSWEPLDYMTYTLDGATIHFQYTRVREGTLAFKENSTFQFNDRNTEAIGTYNVSGSVITLNGVWQNGDAGEGTAFEVSGTISGGTIGLTGDDFWGIMSFNKATEPWYPKD